MTPEGGYFHWISLGETKEAHRPLIIRRDGIYWDTVHNIGREPSINGKAEK